MGKSLIIKGADFSKNALLRTPIVMPIEQGGYNIAVTSPDYGKIKSDAKRVRTLSTSLIYLEASTKITFLGLLGNNEAHSPLRIDAAIYSSSTPGQDSIIGTLNGETTNYFNFNKGGGDVCSINITRTGWYGFVFTGQDINSEITTSDYNGAVRYYEEAIYN